MSRSLYLLSILQILSAGILAQFPPPPEGVTTVNSKECDGASLSYKQVSNLFPNQVPAFIAYDENRRIFAKQH